MELHKSVKVFPRIFGLFLPGLELPSLCAQEFRTWDGEIYLCPCLKTNPQLMSEAALYKQVSAIFNHRRAKEANWGVWPPSSSKVISGEATSMNH
jgi:hypothetical protein